MTAAHAAPGSRRGLSPDAGPTAADLRARDAALMAPYAAGDPDAARDLVALFAPRTLALAQRMLGTASEAEEVAQEALLKLWKIAPDWRGDEAQISTWLYRVTSNLCTDRLRKTRPQPLPDDWDAPDPAPGVEARMIASDRAQALRHALSGLNERQRQAVMLRHFEDRSNPDIAQIMGLSVEAVESLLSRGRRALRAALAGTDEDPTTALRSGSPTTRPAPTPRAQKGGIR